MVSGRVAVKCVNAITLDHETTFHTFRNQESSVFAFLWYIFSSTAHSRNNYGTLSMICRFGFPRTYCLSFPLTNKHLAQLDYRLSEWPIGRHRTLRYNSNNFSFKPRCIKHINADISRGDLRWKLIKDALEWYHVDMVNGCQKNTKLIPNFN